MFTFKNEEVKAPETVFYPRCHVDSYGDACFYFVKKDCVESPFNIFFYIKPNGEVYFRTQNQILCIGQAYEDSKGRLVVRQNKDRE